MLNGSGVDAGLRLTGAAGAATLKNAWPHEGLAAHPYAPRRHDRLQQGWERRNQSVRTGLLSAGCCCSLLCKLAGKEYPLLLRNQGRPAYWDRKHCKTRQPQPNPAARAAHTPQRTTHFGPDPPQMATRVLHMPARATTQGYDTRENTW
jgi:hypothetical protein